MSKKRHGLGRLPSTDLRDHLFLASPKRAAPGVTSRSWYSGGVMDQGATSQCVAYSGCKFLEAGPIRNKRHLWHANPHPLYKLCQLFDEWPGDNYEGTSVRALFKVLQANHYVGEYRWAFDVGTVRDYVLTTGPMVVGTIWADSMFNVDAKGFIRVGGEVIGGHAYTLIGCNTKRRCPDGTVGAFRILNSWSSNWGENGRAWVSFKDFAVLLREDGEACCATEAKAA